MLLFRTTDACAVTKGENVFFMYDEHHKVDIRVIKTKKAIREGVLRLLSEKPIDEISITELAQEAQINRKTFYNYYQSPHQVLDELESEIVEEFVNAVNASDWHDWYDGQDFDFRKIFSCITSSVQKNRDIYRYLLNIRQTSDIMIKIENRLKVEALEYFLRYLDVGSELMEMLLDYVISGMFSVYRKWFRSGQQEPAEVIVEKIGVLSIGAANAFFGRYQLDVKKMKF